jgi:hypothetical protein
MLPYISPLYPPFLLVESPFFPMGHQHRLNAKKLGNSTQRPPRASVWPHVQFASRGPSMDWSEGKLENWLETTVLPSDCRKVSFDFVSLQPSLHTLIGYSSANMDILRPEKSSSGCFLIVVSMWTRWKTSININHVDPFRPSVAWIDTCLK